MADKLDRIIELLEELVDTNRQLISALAEEQGAEFDEPMTYLDGSAVDG